MSGLDLSAIPRLDAGELRGWWWQVHKLRLRDALPGERAALLKRAQELGVELR